MTITFYSRNKIMIISDLNHFAVISEATDIVGGAAVEAGTTSTAGGEIAGTHSTSKAFSRGLKTGGTLAAALTYGIAVGIGDNAEASADSTVSAKGNIVGGETANGSFNRGNVAAAGSGGVVVAVDPF